MKLTFYGAAREVTGSCHCLEANGQKILIDCGLQQGQDEKENQQLPFHASLIDVVILTHAHIDHSGRLPLLVKNGFQGKIYATRATCDLISIMLRDSAHIQELDAKWANQKGRRAGKEPAVPLYTMLDAEDTLQYLVPCEYGEELRIAPGVRLMFTDAGHLLGSAYAQLWLSEDGVEKKIVFSGDIGNKQQPIIRDPQIVEDADYVVMESTYGDRNHEPRKDYTADLARIINDTLAGGGNVVIPSFAVGRTQELLYFIREIKERKLVTSVPDFPVYVDSPLASEATRIYDGDLTGYADEETIEVLKKGFQPIRFSNLRITQTTDESKLLNEDPTPKVIISSSGMCEAGRIRHHLKHNLWRQECSIIFVGFQAAGTLGRILLDGARQVKLFGEEISVKAHIYNFRGLSAHADKEGLLWWIHSFREKPKQVFVVHGENETCLSFVKTLAEEGFSAWAPNFEAIYDLASGSILDEGIEYEKLRPKSDKTARASYAYARLLQAVEQLQEVAKHNEGGANKDLAKFADQILALAQKWDR